MTETQAPSATPQHRPGRARGRVVAVFLGIAVVAFAVFGARLATQERLEVELQGWDVARDGALPVRIELYRPADYGVECSVIARDLRQVIVGQIDVTVPAGADEHLVVPIEIPLEGDGVAPEIVGCELVE